MRFKRGDRVEFTSRILEGFGKPFDLHNIVGILAPVNPQDPVIMRLERNFESSGRNWPMEGNLGWVRGYEEFERNGYRVIAAKITSDQGHTFLITDNALEAFP